MKLMDVYATTNLLTWAFLSLILSSNLIKSVESNTSHDVIPRLQKRFERDVIAGQRVVVERFVDSGNRKSAVDHRTVDTIIPQDAEFDKDYNGLTVNLTTQYLFIYNYTETENQVSIYSIYTSVQFTLCF